ncbi:hypothetical protein DFP72DRAFT_848537 [Ephemerocybe angulata]|uniref:Uncharacterized protein n=1 Tax=Ephemerocybe angulata TaxID=980116 RepID=A0A8H6HVG3_9AGAR|nr:hypothetical protein DFP72DRAFT_848537 [Tulosesus angulatus]
MNYKNITPKNALPPLRSQTREEASQVTLPPFSKQFPGYPTTSPPEAQPPRKANLASTIPAVRIIQYVHKEQKRPRKNNLASTIPAVKTTGHIWNIGFGCIWVLKSFADPGSEVADLHDRA